jgi:hypothetical protein
MNQNFEFLVFKKQMACSTATIIAEASFENLASLEMRK